MFLRHSPNEGPEEGTDTVNKKLTAAVCCAALATLAVAGCGSSDGKVDAYAKKVCDQVHPQQQTIQRATSSIASVADTGASPTQVQKIDTAAFQQISDAYKGIGAAVRQAGASPVSNGATVQQNAVKQLNSISASYADLATSVKKLSTSDQTKFAQGLRDVSDQLGALTKSSGDALGKLQAGGVGKAMAKQPGCQKSGSSPSAA